MRVGRLRSVGKPRKKPTGRVASLAKILEITEPHNTGDAGEAPKEKHGAYADFLVRIKMQAPYDRYGQGQDQDIRQHVTDVGEPRKHGVIDASASRNGAIPQIPNGRALESSAEDHDDGQANAGKTERPVEDTPSSTGALPGKKTAVEEKNGELDTSHGGGPCKFECELKLRAQKEELVGEHGIIWIWFRPDFDEFNRGGYSNSYHVLPVS